jgi:hypothetical protein
MSSSDIPPHPVLTDRSSRFWAAGAQKLPKQSQTNSIEQFVQTNRINGPANQWKSTQKKAFAEAAKKVFAV